MSPVDRHPRAGYAWLALAAVLFALVAVAWAGAL